MRFRLLALSGGSVLSACLVTSKVDYDQPVIPAQVERAAPRLKEFQTVPPEAEERCMGDTDPWMGFDVNISDLNREELDVRVVINHKNRVFRSTTLSVEDQQQPYFFCIGKEDLAEDCNFVEVLVSSKFDSSNLINKTVLDEDLASTHWWVIGNAEDHSHASYLDCPDYLPDGGLP